MNPNPTPARSVPGEAALNTADKLRTLLMVQFSNLLNEPTCDYLRDQFARIINAAFEPLLKAREGWQPIESAPKDGTSVLGFFPVLVGYTARQDVVPMHWSGWGGGIWANSTSGHNIDNAPTHWQPLPAPPNAVAREGKETT